MLSRNKLLIGGILLLFAAAPVLAETGFLEIQAQSMKGTDGSTLVLDNAGWVQFIKGRNFHPPVSSISDPTVDNSGVNNLWLGETIATFTGGTGRYEGRMGEGGQGAGTFYFGKSDGDFNNDDRFFIRYWFKEGTDVFYGNSGEKVTSWAGGVIPPFSFPLTTYSVYKAAAPYTPFITLVVQNETTQQELFPDSNASGTNLSNIIIAFSSASFPGAGNITVEVKGDANHSKGYLVQLKKDVNDFTAPDYEIPTSNLAVSLNKQTTYAIYFSDLTATYYARVVAYNYFGETASAAVPFQVVEGGPPGGGIVSATYSFTKTLNLGINQFSVPMGTDIMFDGTTLIVTMQDLINAINDKVGLGTVKTAGWWLASSQTMVGWTNLDSTPVRINGAAADPTGEQLQQDKVYQMSVGAPVTFNLTGTR